MKLIGEGADDAGGVFDDTITEMCQELESDTLPLLIPTPNMLNDIGYNRDRLDFTPVIISSIISLHILSYDSVCRYLLNPSLNTEAHMLQFRFLGILLGVAVRTKKPLDLHLAPAVWKLLAGMTLSPEDIEEVDLLYMRSLRGIRDIDEDGVTEENFHDVRCCCICIISLL